MKNMKTTPADYPILDVIRDRWSPRAFDSTPISEFELKTLFEAARWASSSMNEQPWRFIYAHRGEEAFEKIASALNEGNAWAKEAPVLMLTVARSTFSRNDRPNVAALHDVGLAVANFSIQATSLGLALHQMGGLDKTRAAELFGIGGPYQVVTAIALGRPGSPDVLPDPLRERELKPRERNKVEDFAFHGTFKQ
jgi:nitroreductase